jgi:hypothetical protein
MSREILPGAPLALRVLTAAELDRLARENPRAAASVRIAADFQTALDLIEMSPIHRLQPAELTRDDD